MATTSTKPADETLTFVARELFSNYAHAVRRREHVRAQDFAETLFMIEHGVHRWDNAGVTLWGDFEEQLYERAQDHLQAMHEEAIAAAEL